MTCGRKIGPFDCCSVVEGDCLELMKQLPDGCLDAVITSPPYNLGELARGTGGFADRKKYPNAKVGKWGGGDLAYGYSSHDDAMPYPEYVEWQKRVLGECWRVSTQAVFYNHKPRVQQGLLRTPLDLNPGLPVRQIVIWARAGGLNFTPSAYCPTHEWIVIFARDEFRLISKGASGLGDVWYIPQEECDEHPAPFPEELPTRILETTNTNIVLDPFGGRGTTAGAAKKLGRHFLTFDKSPEYCAIARKRIALVEAQPTLFEPKPEQIALY